MARFELSIDDEIKRILRERAKQLNMSVNSLVRQAILEKLIKLRSNEIIKDAEKEKIMNELQLILTSEKLSK